jgi:hypothetical protein
MKNLLSNWLMAALMGFCLIACSPQSTAQAPAPANATSATQTNPTTKAPRSYRLAIVGYNYTDDVMDSFEVNGQGGGNLEMSTESDGGGKTVCCVGWRDDSTLPKKITVKWVGGYCTDRRTNSDGETRDRRENLWKVADLEFNGPVPAEPSNFEVHFYPDGHIELAMSERFTPPRYQRQTEPDRLSRRKYPACPKNYRSVEAYDNPTRVNATRKSQP